MLPSHVYGNNAASLFLVCMQQPVGPENHIEIRERFDGTVELRHVRSENNTSDINSKNTSTEIHQKLSDS